MTNDFLRRLYTHVGNWNACPLMWNVNRNSNATPTLTQRDLIYQQNLTGSSTDRVPPFHRSLPTAVE